MVNLLAGSAEHVLSLVLELGRQLLSLLVLSGCVAGGRGGSKLGTGWLRLRLRLLAWRLDTPICKIIQIINNSRV